MIATVVLSAVVTLSLQAPTSETQQLTAKEIFQEMLSRYHTAKSVSGTVVFEQTATSGTGEKRVTITTRLAVSKPKKFFIEQSRNPRDDVMPNAFVAVSDGKKMGYTVPKGLLPGDPPKLFEAVPDYSGVSEGLDAFAPLLLDRSFPIAVAFYNEYEMRLLTQELSNLTLMEDRTVGEQAAWVIKADYTRFRRTANRPEVKIPIYFYVSKAYDLLGLVYEEGLVDGGVQYTITSRWTVKLQRDVEIPETAFIVR